MALQKKVAYISHKPPFPIVDGGSLAVNKLLMQLLNLDIDLSSYFIETPKHPLSQSLPAGINFSPVKINTQIRPIPALFDLLLKKNIQYTRFTRIPDVQIIETDPELVILDGLWAFPFYEKYFKGIPFVLRAHNVEANVSKEQQGLQGKFLQFQSKSLAKIEQYVFNQADEIWCISETDKQAIEQKGFFKADVLPLDLTIQDLSSSPSTKIRLGFIGAMNWGPNKEAVEWILNELAPTLDPEKYEIHLAGEGAPEYNGKLKVVRHGFVSNTDEFYQNIDISLAPILSGSGVKIKVLESLSRGIPVIATDKGIEGLIAPKESGVLITKLNQFHKHLKKLSFQKETLQEHQANGRAYIEKYYSHQAVQTKLIKLLEHVG